MASKLNEHRAAHGMRESRSWCGRIAAFSGNETSGQSLVEFALLLPVMLMLFFGTMEFGRLWFTRLTVRHAVVEATRFAVTGSRLTDPETGDPLGRVESIERHLRNSSYTLDIESIDIDPPDGGGAGGGRSGHSHVRLQLHNTRSQEQASDGTIRHLRVDAQ